jgi:hypothetical protein
VIEDLENNAVLLSNIENLVSNKFQVIISVASENETLMLDSKKIANYQR